MRPDSTISISTLMRRQVFLLALMAMARPANHSYGCRVVRCGGAFKEREAACRRGRHRWW